MRQIDQMSDTEIDVLHLKGMLSTTTKTSTQKGKVWDEKAEHENDLRWESRQEYENDQLAGNPPEYVE